MVKYWRKDSQLLIKMLSWTGRYGDFLFKMLGRTKCMFYT